MCLLPQISTSVLCVHSILPTQMGLPAGLIIVPTLPTYHCLPRPSIHRLNDDRRGHRVVTTTAFTVVSLRMRLRVLEHTRRVAAEVSAIPLQVKLTTRMNLDVSSHHPKR